MHSSRKIPAVDSVGIKFLRFRSAALRRKLTNSSRPAPVGLRGRSWLADSQMFPHIKFTHRSNIWLRILDTKWRRHVLPFMSDIREEFSFFHTDLIGVGMKTFLENLQLIANCDCYVSLLL